MVKFNFLVIAITLLNFANLTNCMLSRIAILPVLVKSNLTRRCINNNLNSEQIYQLQKKLKRFNELKEYIVKNRSNLIELEKLLPQIINNKNFDSIRHDMKKKLEFHQRLANNEVNEQAFANLLSILDQYKTQGLRECAEGEELLDKKDSDSINEKSQDLIIQENKEIGQKNIIRGIIVVFFGAIVVSIFFDCLLSI